MVWTTSEGTEKRLVLPIEMIKEELMDDPEHFMSTFERGELSEDEYQKMKEAIKEMRGSMRKETSSGALSGTAAGGKFDESALLISAGATYIGDNDDPPEKEKFEPENVTAIE